MLTVKISTDNQSIFDRFCDAGDWAIYWIPEYACNEIWTAIKIQDNPPFVLHAQNTRHMLDLYILIIIPVVLKEMLLNIG